ncbi:MAG: leucine--tRNA ligase [Candidatus Micrarchaeota archaeon]
MFDFKSAEKKWQKEWQAAKLFEANPDPEKPKFFITFPYPYLNGSMHVGHSYSFFRTDAYARFKRLQGYNVLFPQGFHATGEPIMGTVERLRNNDQAQVENFKKAGATAQEIETFKQGPEYVAKFWMQKWIADLSAAGASIDWRRKFITTDLTPTYSRFIEWQYDTLRKKGYVVQGTHPVIWCPHDNSPTGDHDRYIGEGESPVEYAILKFEIDFDGGRLILPCATLRPETVYGVTNIWLNPDGKYVKAKVDGESWVISEYAAVKLADQQHDVKIIGDIDPKSLIGKKCSIPLLKEPVPMLPARFVSTEHATGVVMSVPAHAPYDFIALEDLMGNQAELQKFGLNHAEISSIKPVSLISIEGYGDFPAVDECERLKISSQKDVEKLEDATSNIYKKEFHQGVLKKAFGKFAGMKVSECKVPLIEYFKQIAIASSIFESTAEVVCRCMTRCHVKILENQWFLKFSDKGWKASVLEHLKSMQIYPEEARLQMENTIDWLQNKACARKGGLGTKIPWDEEWKVETLSDSTIYMAYYTISRVINENNISPGQLPDEVLDFIFLGEGALEDAAKRTSLRKELLLEMKFEFEYFYPVDLRNSGKDLLQNHLLFYLFHHAAIFKEGQLPRAISINGYVTVEGEKMSKSKGNFIPVYQLLNEYGADLVRINIAASGEALDDADWKNETIKTYARMLDFIYETALNLNSHNYAGASHGRAEKLLESKIEICVKNAAENMEKLSFRSVAHYVVFEAIESVRKYAAAKGKDANFEILQNSISKITLMLSPFTPHFSEEIWHLLGNANFCSTAQYPRAIVAKIDYQLEEEEKYLETIAGDVQKIIDLKNAKPPAIRLFIAEAWKTNLLKLSLAAAADAGKFDIPALIKKAMENPDLKPFAPKIPQFLQAISKTVNYYKSEKIPDFSEQQLLLESLQMLEQRFSCKFEIYPADATQDKDPHNKAGRALPLKPAIYLVV